MSVPLGDFDTSTVLYGKFTTYRPSTGAPFTLAGTPALSVYKDNSTTQSTTGVTLTVDFDSVTGLHHFAIDTSADGTFYAAGSFFDIVITTGTVDSVSAVGTVVGSFTLRKTSALKPTVAGRALDVSTGGEAGVDWANVGSPTTTLVLSGTTVKTATDVETDTQDIQGRLPAALITGRIDASVGAMASAVLTASAIAADAITDAKVAADVTIASVTGSVGSVATNGITGGSFAAGAMDAALLDLINGIETGLTLRQALRLIAAACAGKASGLATTTATYRNAVADTTDRLVATVDANGNRTAITYTLG
jgi:hypothetical protein